MEIMNYNQMLENANAVKVLVNKTIECSKDYTDCKKTDIIDQIIEWVAATLDDVLHDDICYDKNFQWKASQGSPISFGRYGGEGTGAIAQFFFAHEGMYLRAYFSPVGHWICKDLIITDNGLKSLIKQWPEMKHGISKSIQDGVNYHNCRLSDKLSRQLELHDAIKNFKI